MCDEIMFPELNCPDYDGWPCPDDDQDTVTGGAEALDEWEALGGQTWHPATYPSTAGAFACELDQANSRIKWDGSWVSVTIDERKGECADSTGRKWKVEHSTTFGGYLAGSTVALKHWDGSAAHARLLG